ncbi:ABC-three component system protein [Acinetobacter haemolyticus]|uniref:ABC-three component system protein n=1 Tax=Acinetobacter haemolyticus TaxID=29430 RepID=UPI000C2BF7B7|nr:ABC-three component system protein [Acinetobacter haemolyticus]ATZ66132.1 hypothetical protein BSR56_01355 [Acinetobacter haemolyticus]
MQKKLKLKQSDAYDYLVATQFAAESVIAYLEDDEHSQRIGNEQGDIDEWDDIVLHGWKGGTLHCQVKRQLENFCNSDLTREMKKRGQKQGIEMQELSALDSAFQKLGTYYESNINNENSTKLFRLVVPYTNLQIKKTLALNNLKSVCLSCQTAGATLESFQNEQGHSVKVREWLKSWCGFQTEEAIFKCLSNLEIVALAEEADIKEKIIDKLKIWFEQPDLVEQRIRNFISDNASAAHSLTPRLIVEHIKEYLKLDQRMWTRYSRMDALNWQISGTLCGHQTNIEPPAEIINKLWKSSEGRKYELQFAHSFNVISNQSLDFSLLRLALHVSNNVNISAKESSGWKANLDQKVRYTLGTSNTDLSHMNWIDKTNFRRGYEYRELNTTTNLNKESQLLEKQMDLCTWEKIKIDVNTRIINQKQGEVRDAMEELWLSWKSEIEMDPSLQETIAANMLSTNIENCQILGRLRAGPRTVELIGQSLIMMLHLAIGLNFEKIGWKSLSQNQSIKVVALLFWAGTQQNNHLNIRRFFDLDNDQQRSEFLGSETSKILVLPNSSISDSIIYGRHLASGVHEGDGIADSRTPLAVINQYQDYLDAVDKNNISSLKEFFSKKINTRSDSRIKHIQTLTGNTEN